MTGRPEANFEAFVRERIEIAYRAGIGEGERRGREEAERLAALPTPRFLDCPDCEGGVAPDGTTCGKCDGFAQREVRAEGGPTYGPCTCNVNTPCYDMEVGNHQGSTTMAKDKTITMRFDGDHLAAIDYMVSRYPDSPLRLTRTDIVSIALLQMAERLDAEHGTDFHEVMMEAMSDD